LLPNGLVIKPSPEGNGDRWVIGQFHGPVVLEKPDGGTFDLAAPGPLTPGDRWPGPSTTGLACVIDARTGTLRAESVVPTAEGLLQTTFEVWKADPVLARGFSLARPYEGGGRVRVTANGHVITNRQRRGQWECVYVGLVDVAKWPHVADWADGLEVGSPYRIDVNQIDTTVKTIEDIDEILEEADDNSIAFHGDHEAAAETEDAHDEEKVFSCEELAERIWNEIEASDENNYDTVPADNDETSKEDDGLNERVAAHDDEKVFSCEELAQRIWNEIEASDENNYDRDPADDDEASKEDDGLNERVAAHHDEKVLSCEELAQRIWNEIEASDENNYDRDPADDDDRACAEDEGLDDENVSVLQAPDRIERSPLAPIDFDPGPATWATSGPEISFPRAPESGVAAPNPWITQRTSARLAPRPSAAEPSVTAHNPWLPSTTSAASAPGPTTLTRPVLTQPTSLSPPPRQGFWGWLASIVKGN
jgi:hypothetical protein